jgi:N-acetylmuramoyl-L-alanine amidase
MSRKIRIFWALVMCAVGWGVMAQEFSGLARVQMAGSRISTTDTGVELHLQLSQGVPFRAFTLEGPPRLVLDFREVDWAGFEPGDLLQGASGLRIRVGGIKPGWSRMVVDLAGPDLLQTANMNVDEATGRADLLVALRRGSEADFKAASGQPDLPGWDYTLQSAAAPRKRGEGPVTILLDPGHGGIDPGAEVDGAIEKDLMLTFARELKEALIRADDFKVFLTREDDSFVSLERRVAIAHRVGADVMLSLHADILSEGRARGATAYVLSESATDAASAALAERHNRADMLAGVDLHGTDDVVADILIDLARLETVPRAKSLSEALIKGIEDYDLPLNSRPLRAAGFSVLKSPDIPSVLLELGYLSYPRDLKNLSDPAWRRKLAAAIAQALVNWRISDAAAADLVRQ